MQAGRTQAARMRPEECERGKCKRDGRKPRECERDEMRTARMRGIPWKSGASAPRRALQRMWGFRVCVRNRLLGERWNKSHQNPAAKAAAFISPARKCREKWDVATNPAGMARVLTHTLKAPMDNPGRATVTTTTRATPQDDLRSDQGRPPGPKPASSRISNAALKGRSSTALRRRLHGASGRFSGVSWGARPPLLPPRHPLSRLVVEPSAPVPGY
jgi:hypothetical protein